MRYIVIPRELFDTIPEEIKEKIRYRQSKNEYRWNRSYASYRAL